MSGSYQTLWKLQLGRVIPKNLLPLRPLKPEEKPGNCLLYDASATKFIPPFPMYLFMQCTPLPQNLLKIHDIWLICFVVTGNVKYRRSLMNEHVTASNFNFNVNKWLWCSSENHNFLLIIISMISQQ